MSLVLTLTPALSVVIYSVLAGWDPNAFIAGITVSVLVGLGVAGYLVDGIEDERDRLATKAANLEEQIRRKELFLAGVSHEVRSPLTAMMGFIELVNESGEALPVDERAEMLQTVSRQATDVLGLVEDLLASARVEAGNLSVSDVRVNLGAQARQVIEGIGDVRRSITFVGEDVIGTGDPARIRQIVRNLLTNALRYGGEEIVLATEVASDRAVLEVVDNGAGIPIGDREAVFEAFARSSGTAQVKDSVGLGLHVSRDLARLMEGDLTYRYVDGFSRFRLELPLYIDGVSSRPVVTELTA